MTERVISSATPRPATSSSSGQSTATDTGASARQGTLLGQTVRVVDMQSAVQNAAEEISMHIAEKRTEKKDGDVERTLTDKLELMKIQEISDYLENVGKSHKSGELGSWAASILSQKKMPSAGQLLQQAQEQFPSDPTQQYLALQWLAAEATKEKLSKDALDEIREAIFELEEKEGKLILGNLNTAEVAKQSAESVSGQEATQQIESFQEQYQEVLHGSKSIRQTLVQALAHYGGENLEQSLQLFLSALSKDLKATRPSDKERIAVAMTDIQHAISAATVLDRCKNVINFQKTFGADLSAEANLNKLLEELLTIVEERWIVHSRFSELAGQFSPPNHIKAVIHFLSEIRRTLKEIPTSIFSDNNQRDAVLSAVQTAFDNAADRET